MGMLQALWRYRGFIFGSVKREFQSRYRNSLLGAAWTVLNPLAMIAVYTLIFSQVMQTRLPGVSGGFAYSIYLCAGSLTWGLFAEIVARSQTIFLENANLLKKISFPRLCLPVIMVMSAVTNFLIIYGLFLAFLVLAGEWPGWVVFGVLPVLAIQLLFAIGLGMVLGVLNVFFRDVGQFFGIFTQFWFWLTPIVYPASILPEGLRPWMGLNPMYPLIQSYQTIFVTHSWPEWGLLIYPLFLGTALCALGLRLFRRHAGDMVDEL